MEIKTFAELIAPDERTLCDTPWGLGPPQSPEYACEFQHRCIASADLTDSVPDEVRRSYDRLRMLHTYGLLFYDAFTLVTDLRWVVLEQALGERFVAQYSGNVVLKGI
jgi:hypothetical protein